MHTVNFRDKSVNYAAIFDFIITSGGQLELVVSDSYTRLVLVPPGVSVDA